MPLPLSLPLPGTLATGNWVYLLLDVGFIQMLKSFTPVVVMVFLFLFDIEVRSRSRHKSFPIILLYHPLLSLSHMTPSYRPPSCSYLISPPPITLSYDPLPSYVTPSLICRTPSCLPDSSTAPDPHSPCGPGHPHHLVRHSHDVLLHSQRLYQRPFCHAVVRGTCVS